MGVDKYKSRGRTYWQIDAWLTVRDGKMVRFRQRLIPTKEQAVALLAKQRAAAFEGRFLQRTKVISYTVEQLWKEYEKVCRRDNDSWSTEVGRAAMFLKHLGRRDAVSLTQQDVDEYRARRDREETRRGGPPASATLDREVELLKRIMNYAVRCGRLKSNPLSGVPLLRKPNTRQVVIDEAGLAKLMNVIEPELRPILLVAFDTGMRRGEITHLRWPQVDLRNKVICLASADTKTEQPRTIIMTQRVFEAIKNQPRHISSTYVFPNQQTGKPWTHINHAFRRATGKAGMVGAWFHDLRRSFITNARRRGVPESVIMRMSGHRTRAVFDRYNIIGLEDLREAVRMIEEGSTRERLEDEAEARAEAVSKEPEKKKAG